MLLCSEVHENNTTFLQLLNYVVVKASLNMFPLNDQITDD